jgi:argininosuccinate lyase
MQDARMSLGLLAGMLRSAEFNTGRMEEEAGKGFSTATELADTLVREFGLPFRTAHNIVGRAVQKNSLSLATIEKAAQEIGKISLKKKGLTQEKIDEVLDVNYSVALRKAVGGPAPSETRRAVISQKKRLAADSAVIDRKNRHLAEARENLINEAGRLVP